MFSRRRGSPRSCRSLIFPPGSFLLFPSFFSRLKSPSGRAFRRAAGAPVTWLTDWSLRSRAFERADSGSLIDTQHVKIEPRCRTWRRRRPEAAGFSLRNRLLGALPLNIWGVFGMLLFTSRLTKENWKRQNKIRSSSIIHKPFLSFSPPRLM